jgi:hypothetical protein
LNKQFDFTYRKLGEILDCFLSSGYLFQTFEDFLNNPAGKSVILRHDVDKNPLHSLHTAKMEYSKGIRGTYYFRALRQSFDERIIKEIAGMGHEVGYHYEDVSLAAKRQKAKGKRQKAGSLLMPDMQDKKTARQQDNMHIEGELALFAIESFKENLARLRELVPVKTISMHGSPMSRWDPAILWKYYDYRDFGITGEPYFDIDFDKVLYLTDTGRKWNGDKSSVRDKVFQKNFFELKQSLKFSDQIIASARRKELPEHTMITIHPQRWSDDLLSWSREYFTQKLKNWIKQMILVR